MLKKEQEFGVYKIKDILHHQGAFTCCLTEDPFFHSSVILNVFSMEEVDAAGQRRVLEERLDQLFSA